MIALETYASSSFAMAQEARSSVGIAETISSELSVQRGFSALKKRRFCAELGFCKTSTSPDARLESEVASAVAEDEGSLKGLSILKNVYLCVTI